MNKLALITQESGEEAWLFADLFASLLMTIVLLVNAHTSVNVKTNEMDTGKAPPKTRLVYVIDAKTVRMDDTNSPNVSVDTLITNLQQEKSRAEIVGTSSNDGVELFQLFQALQEHQLEYSYSIAQ
jgi:hypothetical protein